MEFSLKIVAQLFKNIFFIISRTAQSFLFNNIHKHNMSAINPPVLCQD